MFLSICKYMQIISVLNVLWFKEKDRKYYSKLIVYIFILLLASKHPVNVERDAGFCSGSSENGDEFNQRDSDPRSPTDVSEDSIEVKLTPIVIPKNKRKNHEPARLILESDFPLKKRIRYEDKPLISPIKSEPLDNVAFRPWASVAEEDLLPNPAEDLARHPGVTTLHRVSNQHNQIKTNNNDIQEQPLALLKKRVSTSQNDVDESCSSTSFRRDDNKPQPFSFHPTQTVDTNFSSESMLLVPGCSNNSSDSFESQSGDASKSIGADGQHRNYKNMTRERRIEANARERTRVHTISAAFDTLRKSIPSYSQSQKLSKLSVLRVACSYILTLSRIAGDDYSPDQSEPSVNECAEEVSRTIQTEGKVRKKKDE